MSGAGVWLCVALGLATLTARRRSMAIAAVTAQAAVLAALALTHDAPGDERLGSALALVLRSAVLAGALLFVVHRTREARPVRANLGPMPRGALGIGLALLLAALAPDLGLESRDVERATLALVAFGLVAAAVRRATLFQVVGLIVLENGLVLAALGVPGGASVAIELGAALDLLLVGVVAAAFHRQIFAEFGDADTARLRSLRD